MLKALKKHLESSKDIFDIIIYGSSLKGELSPRDIDILVIFLKGVLRERLDKIQRIKSDLMKTSKKNYDLKQIILKDLFKPEFLAKTGIFLEGISVSKEKNFSEILGFKPYTLFWYNLGGLTHNQKVKFNYILAGRNSKGIIEELAGKRLVNGAVKIPIKNSLEFEKILKMNKVNYKKSNILEEC